MIEINLYLVGIYLFIRYYHLIRKVPIALYKWVVVTSP